jgi:hypothetical protein
MDQTNHLLAQTAHSLPALTGSGITPVGNGVTNLEKIINTGIGLLTLIGVLFFVFNIILAGYAFISSQGDEKKMAEARSRITNSVLGLAIVIMALAVASLIAKLLGLNNILDLNQVFSTLTF